MIHSIGLRGLLASIVLTTPITVAGPILTPGGELTLPPQPTSGPGGSDYTRQQVVGRQFGSASTGYYLFEPAEPTPESAPVVVFVHGYGEQTPNSFTAVRNALNELQNGQHVRPELDKFAITGHSCGGMGL